MSYLDLNMNLSETELALKTNANKFAREVMRPISIQLDQMTAEEVIAPKSPFWDFLRKAYELGYHKLPYPEIVGGGGLTPSQMKIVMEELAWGSIGLTLSLHTTLDAVAAMGATQKHVKEFTIPYANALTAASMVAGASRSLTSGRIRATRVYPSSETQKSSPSVQPA